MHIEKYAYSSYIYIFLVEYEKTKDNKEAPT